MISFITILLYILYNIYKYGVPNSLSETYYNNKYTFSIILIFCGITCFYKMIQISDYHYISFITLSGILFVAFAPNFRENSLIDSVHTYSAVIALIFSQIWVALTYYKVLLIWILLLVYIIFNFKRKLLEIPKIKFIAEIIMLLTIYLILYGNKY